MSSILRPWWHNPEVALAGTILLIAATLVFVGWECYGWGRRDGRAAARTTAAQPRFCPDCGELLTMLDDVTWIDAKRRCWKQADQLGRTAAGLAVSGGEPDH